MSYVVIKNSSIKMDLVVKKEYQPQLVSYIERMGCTYAKETAGEKNGFVCLHDISAPCGRNIGELIGLFYSLEWGHLVEGLPDDKFYILLNTRKKAKKHVHKNRKETDSGSEGGDRGEPSGNPGSEQVGGPAGDRLDAGNPVTDDLWESPRVG